MSPGKLIVVEGTEGAGKSSQIKVIKKSLIEAGAHEDQIVLTREPGGTPISEEIREIILSNRDEKVDGLTELYLVFAARQQHVASLIRPALNSGKIVICDRFLLSTYGYQGFGRGIPIPDIKYLSDKILDQITPDLTLLFDIDPETGLTRAKKTGEPDRIESSSLDFFRRIRMGMRESLYEVTKSGKIIDSSQEMDKVSENVAIAVKLWASKNLAPERGCEPPSL